MLTTIITMMITIMALTTIVNIRKNKNYDSNDDDGNDSDTGYTNINCHYSDNDNNEKSTVLRRNTRPGGFKYLSFHTNIRTYVYTHI